MRKYLVLLSALVVFSTLTLAQEKNEQPNETRHQEAMENSVHIVNGPTASPARDSVTINWTTNKTATNDVWLMGPGIRGHRVFYLRNGSREHTATFANLRPGTTYTYEIRTREGGDRRQGSFTTMR
jgi:hypothetical protein